MGSIDDEFLKRENKHQISLSEFGSNQDEKIRKDPYAVFELPFGAPIAEVKQKYRHLARMYHADLVNPQTIQSIKRKYSPQELQEVDLTGSIDDLIVSIKGMENMSTEDPIWVVKIREMAHKKMVQLNIAYAYIKALDQTKGQELAGFRPQEIWDPYQECMTKVINLDAQARVILFDKSEKHWAAGAYLEFDFGSNPAPWEFPFDTQMFRAVKNIKYLFAHIELMQGLSVSKILLTPLADRFGLEPEVISKIREGLKKGKGQKEIFRTLPLNSIHFGEKDGSGVQKGTYQELWFDIEEIAHFNLEGGDTDVGLELHKGPSGLEGFTLTDETSTEIKDDDLILLSTIAYGPLLKSQRPPLGLTEMK